MDTPAQSVFAMDIDGKPVIAFEARNLREAGELCREAWLQDDLALLTSNGIPLYAAGAKMKVRPASQEEAQAYRDAEAEAAECDDLLLAYLVELDSVP
jgi:hypothetical protein